MSSKSRRHKGGEAPRNTDYIKAMENDDQNFKTKCL